MEQKTLSRLEFDKIASMLEKEASSLKGKALSRNLRPLQDLEKIEALQEQTWAAFERIVQGGKISFGSADLLDESFKRLEIGAALTAGELLKICQLLNNAALAKSYGRRARREGERDALDAFFDRLDPLEALSAKIERCIVSEDEISDDASPALKGIRRNISAVNEKIHETLVEMVNGRLHAYLQEALVTMRNSRYCLPVKAEYRGNVPGIIHAQSSTGSTLFIEPISIVYLNNDLKELYGKERKEIDAILANLSAQAAQNMKAIKEDDEALTELDFIFARGALALSMNGVRPLLNIDGRISIRQGRHPLLDPKRVVPIDISLGKDFTMLIITGPNTGGKTVSLKTVGLLTLMAQAGLFIPAKDRSEIAVFRSIYADIGDEQSIEQSLSTFSSHMKNIVSSLKNIDESSLLLYDELGAGTDPTEGAALAISILSYLHERKIPTVATTHYSELKIFAMTTEGVENACCEFDVNTLMPTYRLLTGLPGKSNAFAISRKLGLPEFIIDDARRRLKKQDISFEDILSDLEDKRQEAEKERAEAVAYKNEFSLLKAEMERKNESLRTQKEKLIRQARDEAAGILREAKDFADETMKNFRRFKNDNSTQADMERERNRLRQKLEEISYQEPFPATKASRPHQNSDFQIGTSVRVLSLGLTGRVCTVPDVKGNLTVQMGILKSQANISGLEIIKEKEVPEENNKKESLQSSFRLDKAQTVSSEINLIGETVDEALFQLEKYLDDALLTSLENVRIVHGKGTGALRKGIQEFLKKQKYVKSFRSGNLGEGGSGVTIVELK